MQLVHDLHLDGALCFIGLLIYQYLSNKVSSMSTSCKTMITASLSDVTYRAQTGAIRSCRNAYLKGIGT
jgi:hypothetical protein